MEWYIGGVTDSDECVDGAGPKLFTACPMDVSKSRTWFTDLWNYFIVSYLAEAVRQSLQVHAAFVSF